MSVPCRNTLGFKGASPLAYVSTSFEHRGTGSFAYFLLSQQQNLSRIGCRVSVNISFKIGTDLIGLMSGYSDFNTWRCFILYLWHISRVVLLIEGEAPHWYQVFCVSPLGFNPGLPFLPILTRSSVLPEELHLAAYCYHHNVSSWAWCAFQSDRTTFICGLLCMAFVNLQMLLPLAF